MVAAGKNPKKRTRKKKVASCSHLPEEIWENIFKFLTDNNYTTFNSLSLVSKQFLSITNSVRFSIKIRHRTIPFLHDIFQRFPKLTSLDISISSKTIDLDEHLTQISTFPKIDLDELLTQISTFPNLSDIKSLRLTNPKTNIPEDGLRALSKKMKKLTSLNCSKVKYIDKNHLFLIADCFPLLEELTLTEYGLISSQVSRNNDFDDQLLELPKLRKIFLYGNLVHHLSIKDLCKNCDLQEVKVIDCLSWRRTVMITDL